MKNKYYMFSTLIPQLDIFKHMIKYLRIAGVEKEGFQTMESAWNIMEKFFWDEKFGLYKVPVNICT